jgi:hypothetical protein
MKSRITRWAPLAAVAAVLLALGSTASADTVFTLNIPNSGISAFTGPYGTVDIDLVNSTTATITLTALSNGGNYYAFGSDGAFGVNVNATSWSVSGLTGTAPATHSGPSFTNDGAKSEDGFGTFNQTFKEFDGAGYSLTSVMFTLTNTGGVWADSGSVLAPTAGGYYTAAHVYVFATSDYSLPSLATGYATAVVPEPSSLAMAGIAALGFGANAWRQVRKGKKA